MSSLTEVSGAAPVPRAIGPYPARFPAFQCPRVHFVRAHLGVSHRVLGVCFEPATEYFASAALDRGTGGMGCDWDRLRCRRAVLALLAKAKP